MAFDFEDSQWRVDELRRFEPGKPRGDALEELVAEMLGAISGVEVGQPNVLSASGDQEIDRLVTNRRADDGLVFFPQDFLIECKSQETAVDATSVDRFAIKLAERNLELGLLATLAGVTGKGSFRHGGRSLEKAAIRGQRVLVLWTSELALIRSAGHLANLLEAKRRASLSGWVVHQLDAPEMRSLDPERREGGVSFRNGIEAIERAIAEARRDALQEMIDRADGTPSDSAEPVADARDLLGQLSAEAAKHEQRDYDPFWSTARTQVIDFGASVARQRRPPPFSGEEQRILRFEVERSALGGLKPWIGGELWTFLSDYFLRRLETGEIGANDHVAVLLAMCIDNIVAIDNIDPHDVYDDAPNEYESEVR